MYDNHGNLFLGRYYEFCWILPTVNVLDLFYHYYYFFLSSRIPFVDLSFREDSEKTVSTIIFERVEGCPLAGHRFVISVCPTYRGGYGMTPWYRRLAATSGGWRFRQQRSPSRKSDAVRPALPVTCAHRESRNKSSCLFLAYNV